MARGSAAFTLTVPLRERSYHSGNWGGLLRLMAALFWNLGDHPRAWSLSIR